MNEVQDCNHFRGIQKGIVVKSRKNKEGQLPLRPRNFLMFEYSSDIVGSSLIDPKEDN